MVELNVKQMLAGKSRSREAEWEALIKDAINLATVDLESM
jgi:hypothetical protein